MRHFTEKNNRFLAVVSMFLFLIFVFCYTGTAATQALHLVGQKPFGFSLTDLKGNTVDLSDYSDKKVVVLLAVGITDKQGVQKIKIGSKSLLNQFCTPNLNPATFWHKKRAFG